MYANSTTKALLPLVLGLLLLPAISVAAVPAVSHDVHPRPDNDEFQRTIEARCTVCHTRERVDEAIAQQADISQLIQHMIERGAILSERDKSVLGTFWGSPLKSETPQEPPTAAPQ